MANAKAEKITSGLAIQGYKEALEESRLALKVIVDKLREGMRYDRKMSRDEYWRLINRGEKSIAQANKLLTDLTTVPSFALQETTCFPDGAPQREEYDSDAAFFAACRKYQAEWIQTYIHPGKCDNRDCPQCWPIT